MPRPTTVKILSEAPKASPNPSSHPQFKSFRSQLFDPLQVVAYQRVGASNLALMAPASSGKTLAVSAPIFEQARPAVFVYPFRALVLDQTHELLEIAQWFGIGREQFGEIMGGASVGEIAEAIERKNYILATPDKLVSLLSAGRSGVGALITLLKSFDFVFDEIHVYNPLMLTSLKYFLRSVKEFRQDTRGFSFLSATFPEETWTLLKGTLGIREQDRIEGKSFSGEIDLIIEPEKTSREASEMIAELIRKHGMDEHCVCIFNTARRAWEVSKRLTAKLFIGQDKMSEKQREDNFNAYKEDFEEKNSRNILCGSPAIEAGVNFKAQNLVIEESYLDSFVQRFGRAGRAGMPCRVLALSNTLFRLQEEKKLENRYTREDFLHLLEAHCKSRYPLKLFSGLAAYSYYNFWKKEETIFDPEDLELCKQLDKKGVDYSPFRGFIPFTEYELGGQKINFKSLFKKDLPVLPNGKVKGSPSPEKYFCSKPRPPVYAQYLGRCCPPETIQEDAKGKRRAVLAKVRFSLFPDDTYWTVLDIDLTDNAEESAKGDDNILLDLASGRGKIGKYSDGRIKGRVRFFEADA